MILTEEILEYIHSHRQESYDLLLELARIPAPSHQEHQRAAFCKAWLESSGVKDVFIDEAQNVICPVGDTGDNPLVVFAAHSDVVFPDTQPLPLKVEDGKIFCPGIGDDTANVAALMTAAKYIANAGILPRGQGVLMVINAGEEGLGNLKGTRRLMQTYGSRIREFVALDDHDCRGVNRAVGSRRFSIAVKTEGGHSFSAFGNRNAIACLAAIITDLYKVRVPQRGKTTYNVGTISGGTSVNTIAQSAQMLYEFRSDVADSLEEMQNALDSVIAAHRAAGMDVTVTPVGERPCSAEVDERHMAQLMERADAASLRHYGRAIAWGSGSTDCNIPLSMGIPAICVGCYFGGGAHTRQEWVSIDSLEPGLGMVFALILHSF